jgi:hypothetical protein
LVKEKEKGGGLNACLNLSPFLLLKLDAAYPIWRIEETYPGT